MKKNWLRFLGISGLLGGLTLFAGDMLFYYDPSSVDFLQNMSGVSDSRIAFNGVIALAATWLYLLGAAQVYYAFSPAKKSLRCMTTLLFAAIFIAYGIVHSAYIAIAATAKLAAAHHLDLAAAVALSLRANQAVRAVVYPLFGLLSVLFIWQVWQKKTLYPRWMVFFFPLLPFLLQGVIVRGLSGKWFVVIAGGYLNLILVLFFAASTLALWHQPREAQDA